MRRAPRHRDQATRAAARARDPDPDGLTALIASFFERLTGLDRIARAVVADAPLSALITVRASPDKQILLDFSRSPLRVVIDDRSQSAALYVSAAAPIMHQVLSGALPAGAAFGRRQLLIRGSASDLARFLPLLDIAPLLYREHLADCGLAGFARRDGAAPHQEMLMDASDGRPEFRGEPIPLETRGRLETMAFRAINAGSYALGYGIGLLRYRALENLSLFEVIGSLSRGVAAAGPGRDEEPRP